MENRKVTIAVTINRETFQHLFLVVQNKSFDEMTHIKTKFLRDIDEVTGNGDGVPTSMLVYVTFLSAAMHETPLHEDGYTTHFTFTSPQP